MKHYAYLDKYGIMHMSSKKDTAAEYAPNGRVLETAWPAEYGYPLWEGKALIVYGPQDMRHGAKEDPIPAVPELAILYKKLNGEEVIF